MIDALVTGRIFGKPAERTSKSGNRFATAKVRVPMPDGSSMFANIITFRDHVATALLALEDGASLAISGELKISTYQAKDGSYRPSLDVTVHEILTEFHVTRRRKAMSKDAEPEPARTSQPSAKSIAAEEDFNDDIPF
ncbi:MAG: single-stranded DNA-binding protein [Steroidobacteraceae bacterium]